MDLGKSIGKSVWSSVRETLLYSIWVLLSYSLVLYPVRELIWGLVRDSVQDSVAYLVSDLVV